MADKTEYRFLGGSGLKVSSICLGTMTFGDWALLPGQCDEAASHAILDRYVELGGNFIDTADVYAEGRSEEIIGSWLEKQQRDKFVVATKVRSNTRKDINRQGLSRHHIMQSIDDSLRRLHTDYVDLYQIHMWDEAVPIEETLLALNDLVRAGKVRYLGASNVTGWQLQKIVDLSKSMGLNKWISLQVRHIWFYNEQFQDIFAEHRPYLALHKSTVKKKSAYNEPAETNGKTLAQVAIRWLLQKDVVSSVIIGAKTLQQLEDNMGAATGWEIAEEQMAELDTVSQMEPTYPYRMITSRNRDRVRKNLCQ
ncbi:1-deoxyxylulose-5-phosphate synthase YajO-like [Branchiostoma floridae]|uniref:1-deoxyxylulose-5-phosphate synthase YajO-like n=1 Tax=Branchiostoma floridae TaxID=7739 RepID=A0A9J7HXM5_BRAFL|nr:1-deoxyxylulose-5-phosphate synthase YajO-like [Branchiostoma floridae]